MNKLKNHSGETVIETLVSIMIAAICMALLVTSVTAAGKINAKVKNDLSQELHFSYNDRGGTGTVVVQIEGEEPLPIDVLMYQNNDYYYYKRVTSIPE